MKITIEISEAEAKGIKHYLREVGELKGAKDEVVAYIENLVIGVINSPQEAVSECIKKYIK